MSISSPAELMKTCGVLRKRQLFKVSHRLGRVMMIGDLPVQRDLRPLGNWVSHNTSQHQQAYLSLYQWRLWIVQRRVLSGKELRLRSLLIVCVVH